MWSPTHIQVTGNWFDSIDWRDKYETKRKIDWNRLIMWIVTFGVFQFWWIAIHRNFFFFFCVAISSNVYSSIAPFGIGKFFHLFLSSYYSLKFYFCLTVLFLYSFDKIMIECSFCSFFFWYVKVWLEILNPCTVKRT